MMTLKLAQQLIPNAKLIGDPDAFFTRVHTDTRSLAVGDLFVALQGETFDAHDFLAQVKASGAVAALAQRGLAKNGLSGLEVADSKIALGVLAKHWRLHLAAKQLIPLIAVTGSNGKTVVKEWLADLCNDAFMIVKNPQSYNSQIGVPLSVWQINKKNNLK